jgi:transforming growth factor-beta-induced protein
MTKTTFALFLTLGLGLAACADDETLPIEPEPGLTIAEIAASNPDFETLSSALDATGLGDALAGEGPFTVFAPTDAAFDRLPEGLVAGLSTEQLADVLRYHVLSGDVDAATAVTLDRAMTLQGSEIQLGTEGDRLYLDGLTLVTTTDIEASNGVIHVIDSVLVPGTFPGTITDVVTTYPRLSMLASAATPAVAEALAADGRTLFAPVDSAFEGVTLPDDVESVLFYHAVADDVPADVAVTLASARTANGAFLAVRTDDGVQLDDSFKRTNVVYTDIRTQNGVIHLIDDVLTPPGTIPEVASRAGFGTLVSLVDSAGLVSALEGEGPFTVFAPTDEAFARLPAEADLSAVLSDILLHHVIAADVDSNAVTDAIAAAAVPETMTGAADNTLSLAVRGDAIVIDGIVSVTMTDVPASNGLIHVIDSIIIPDDIGFPGTIAQAVSAYPSLGSLLDAVTNADPAVLSTLSGAGELTLFAPDNVAFEGVDTSADLTPILLHHALDSRADSSVVAGLVGTSVSTLSGVDIMVSEGPALMDGAGNVRGILRVDLAATNGVIHVIDGVLLPE